MRCLSIRQPWANLIVMGFKDIENRTWKTKHRGPLLIHAGLTVDKFGKELLGRMVQKETITQREADLLKAGPRGMIIGRVNLVDCVIGHPSMWAAEGCWNWVLAESVMFNTLTVFKGRLGLFDVPDGVVGE